MPLASTGVRLAVLDRSLSRPIRRLVDEDAVGGRRGLQPRSGVDHVAGGHSLTLLRACIEPDECLAGGDPHPNVKLPRVVALVQLGDPLSDGQRSADGALGIVLAGGRRAKDGHHGVADELLHRAAVALELEADALVVAGEDRSDVLGVELFRLRREADEIGEEDADDLPLFPRPRGFGSQGRRAGVAEPGALGILLTAVRTGDHDAKA